MERCMVEENKCLLIFSLPVSTKMIKNIMENFIQNNLPMKGSSKTLYLKAMVIYISSMDKNILGFSKTVSSMAKEYI